MRAGLLLLAAALLARAEVFEWWQSTDVPLFSRSSVSAVLHTQFRVRHNFHDLFQGRFGPVVRAPLAGGWNMIAGYYFGESEQQRDEWRNNHRTFFGVDRPFRTEQGVLTIRSMFEQHFGGSNPPDLRVRQSVVWALRAPLTPYWGAETFFDRQGFMQQRFQGGIRKQVTGGYTLDIGYIYDRRQFRAGDHRHAVHTSLRPRKRER